MLEVEEWRRLNCTYLFIYFIIKSNFSRSLSSIRSVQYFTTSRMSSSMGSNKSKTVIKNAFLQPHKQHELTELFLPCIPVMVVTHSRRRVLMSVRSKAPANAGAGRRMNLDRVSGMSGFEVDVEGPFSVWEG